MYGHMLLGLAGFVKLKYGKDIWTKSCKLSGLENEVFFMYEVYDEQTFYRILGAVCGLLDVDSDTLLYDFGYYTFSVYWRNSSHDTLLYGLGDSLQELMQNLNALHHHLSSKYQKMIAPSFTCDAIPEGLLIHYHSARPGLGEYVRGIVTGLASQVYRLNVNVETLEYNRLENGQFLKHYYKLRVSLVGAGIENDLSRLQGSKRETMESLSRIKKMKTHFHVIDSKSKLDLPSNDTPSPVANPDVGWPITPDVFECAAPFHLIFDSQLRITLMSGPFKTIFEVQYCSGMLTLTDLFDIEIPQIALTHGNVLNELNALFVLSVKDGTVSRRVLRPQFRGQMFPISHTPDTSILFLASPSVTDFEQLEQMGLAVADIGRGSSLYELLEKYSYCNPKMDLSGQLEKAKHQLKVEKAEVEKARVHTDSILHRMLPVQVASDLKKNGAVIPREFSQVSILFTAIANFETICEESSSLEVVTLLNDLYTRFDSLVETYQVYKVETVGDSYMMTAGFPDTAERHAHAVTDMAFEMRREARKLSQSHTHSIEISIGIHSGPVVAGVIGTRQPRYCLFGDTVNTASRMNSTGQPGRIHISEATYRHICDSPSYHFIDRGKIFVKGLGLRNTYFVEDEVTANSISYPASSSRKTLSRSSIALSSRVNSSRGQSHHCLIV